MAMSSGSCRLLLEMGMSTTKYKTGHAMCRESQRSTQKEDGKGAALELCFKDYMGFQNEGREKEGNIANHGNNLRDLRA